MPEYNESLDSECLKQNSNIKMSCKIKLLFMYGWSKGVENWAGREGGMFLSLL